MILRMVRVALLRGCKDSKKICFSRRGILGWLSFLLFNVDGRAVGEDDAVGGYLPVSRVYDFRPLPSVLTEEQQKHIIGVQANLKENSQKHNGDDQDDHRYAAASAASATGLFFPVSFLRACLDRFGQVFPIAFLGLATRGSPLGRLSLRLILGLILGLRLLLDLRLWRRLGIGILPTGKHHLSGLSGSIPETFIRLPLRCIHLMATIRTKPGPIFHRSAAI